MKYRDEVKKTSLTSQSSQTALQGIVVRDVSVTFSDEIHFATRFFEKKRHVVTKKSRVNSLLERELRRL